MKKSQKKRKGDGHKLGTAGTVEVGKTGSFFKVEK